MPGTISRMTSRYDARAARSTLALARTTNTARGLVECLDFIGRNDQFFLNVGMAMGKALTDPARNAIIFQGSAEEFAQLRPLIESLDQAAREAIIEATVAEVTLTDNETLGAEWVARNRLYHRVHVIRHDNPGNQLIAISVESQQCLFHYACYFGIAKRTLTVASVQKIFNNALIW